LADLQCLLADAAELEPVMECSNPTG